MSKPLQMIAGMVLAAASLTPGPASGAQPRSPPGGAPGAVAADPSEAVVLDVRSGVHRGRVTSSSADGIQLEPADGTGTGRGAARTIPWRDVVRVDWPHRKIFSTARQPLVLLANGDRLAARVENVGEERLDVRWTRFDGWPAVSVPLETVRGVIAALPHDPARRRRLLQLLSDRRDESDLLVLANQDRIAGELVGGNNEALEFKAAAGLLTLPAAGVAAVGFNPALIEFPRLEGVALRLGFCDGSWLTVRKLEIDAQGQGKAQAACGAAAAFPADGLSCIQVVGAGGIWLASLPPDNEQSLPFVGPPVPVQVDRNAQGGLLSLSGREYASGLGLRSGHTVQFALPANARELRGVAGIDDAAGRKGSAVVRLLVDGKERHRTETLRGGQPPVELPPLDVRNAKTLAIVVEYADRGDILDLVDLCDLVLLP